MIFEARNGAARLPMKHADPNTGVATELQRQIPAVDELLGRPAIKDLEARLGRRPVVDATRRVLQSLRGRISSGALANVSIDALEREIVAATESSAEPSLTPVINATGVI